LRRSPVSPRPSVVWQFLGSGVVVDVVRVVVVVVRIVWGLRFHYYLDLLYRYNGRAVKEKEHCELATSKDILGNACNPMQTTRKSHFSTASPGVGCQCGSEYKFYGSTNNSPSEKMN
jgi:hypothetical protein